MLLTKHRWHLLEIHELSWFPVFLRNFITDVLSSLWIHSHLFFEPAVTQVKHKMVEIVKITRVKTIIDLCSGAAGPSTALMKQLQQQGVPAQMYLTDLFPNVPAFEAAAMQCPDSVHYIDTAIDATNCPANLTSLAKSAPQCNKAIAVASNNGGNANDELEAFRTMFLSFHHMTPALGERILRDAVEKKHGIGIFELQQRTLSTLFIMLLTAWALPILTLFRFKFDWKRVFFTLIVPIVPFILWLDGLVSALRTYSKEEMEELIARVDVNHGYSWQYEVIPVVSRWIPFPLISVIGVPKSKLG